MTFFEGRKLRRVYDSVNKTRDPFDLFAKLFLYRVCLPRDINAYRQFHGVGSVECQEIEACKRAQPNLKIKNLDLLFSVFYIVHRIQNIKYEHGDGLKLGSAKNLESCAAPTSLIYISSVTRIGFIYFAVVIGDFVGLRM